VSAAPLPALRTFWALGGAPGAFVRRDASLQRACEAVVRSAATGAALDVDRSFATLVAGVDLSRVLPVTDDPLVRPEPPEPRRSGGKPNVTTAKGAESRMGTAALTSDRAGSSPVRAVARAERDALAAAPEQRGRQTAGADSAALRRGSDPVPPRRAPGVAVPRLEPDRALPRVGQRATLPNVDWTGQWRPVTPMRAETDPDVIARVATLLADHESPALRPAAPPVRRPSGQPSQPGSGSAESPAVSIAERLGHIVRRIEQRVVDGASHRSRGEWQPPGVERADPVRRSRDESRQLAERPADGPARPRAGSSAVGLQGLVERAPFFDLTTRAPDDLWPDAALDHLSSLLDDAAREGLHRLAAGIG